MRIIWAYRGRYVSDFVSICISKQAGSIGESGGLAVGRAKRVAAKLYVYAMLTRYYSRDCPGARNVIESHCFAFLSCCCYLALLKKAET